MQLFYAEHINENSKHFVFDKTESRHIIRVLRKGAGDPVHITDGKGREYQCVITEPNDKRCQVEITQVVEHKKQWNYQLHIAIAPTKMNDRIEWFLEKATEIGIDQITPIICDHSERKVIKMDRMEKIVVSAMKQSLKFHLPVLNPICSYKEFVSSHIEEEKFIAHCEDRNQNLLKNAIQSDNILILIGPEGDFSSKEIDLAAKYGFTQISLGESRLRTETAALVACNTVSILKQ